MDLPPPTQIESPPAQITTWTADDAYKNPSIYRVIICLFNIKNNMIL